MVPEIAPTKAAFDLSHQLFLGMLGDISPHLATRVFAGSTMSSAAPILAHAVYSEDMMVNQQVRRGTTLLESGDWMAKTGIPMASPMQTPEWCAATYNWFALTEYAAAVFGSTTEYLKSASAADLARPVSTPLGQSVPASEYLATFGVVHVVMHMGEIAAIKGLSGMKGLPF